MYVSTSCTINNHHVTIFLGAPKKRAKSGNSAPRGGTNLYATPGIPVPVDIVEKTVDVASFKDTAARILVTLIELTAEEQHRKDSSSSSSIYLLLLYYLFFNQCFNTFLYVTYVILLLLYIRRRK